LANDIVDKDINMTMQSPIDYILHKLKNYFADLSGRFQLKESITGLAQCHTTYLPVAIFDLNNLLVPEENRKIELRSFAFGASNDENNPSFATMAIENNIAYNNTPYFVKDMRGNLKQQKNKPSIEINEPAILLPYYTTHFGHFTGDCLGAIIALSQAKRLEDRKLFYIAPNSFDELINQYGNSAVLQKIDSRLAYENNLIFSNASLLPRLSSWQNLSLCSQIFESVGMPSENNHVTHKHVFLTSGRSSRIKNIDEVIEHLSTKGFFICRPDLVSFEECLHIVRHADCLISENGSIIHNALISRNKPFYILSSDRWRKLSGEEFAGGGIYNSYKSYLANYIECKTTSTTSHHAFSDQLIVNLADIDQII
jgi:capsular polysaccharide biosynthesis protein